VSHKRRRRGAKFTSFLLFFSNKKPQAGGVYASGIYIYKKKMSRVVDLVSIDYFEHWKKPTIDTNKLFSFSVYPTIDAKSRPNGDFRVRDQNPISDMFLYEKECDNASGTKTNSKVHNSRHHQTGYEHPVNVDFRVKDYVALTHSLENAVSDKNDRLIIKRKGVLRCVQASSAISWLCLGAGTTLLVFAASSKARKDFNEFSEDNSDSMIVVTSAATCFMLIAAVLSVYFETKIVLDLRLFIGRIGQIVLNQKHRRIEEQTSAQSYEKAQEPKHTKAHLVHTVPLLESEEALWQTPVHSPATRWCIPCVKCGCGRLYSFVVLTSAFVKLLLLVCASIPYFASIYSSTDMLGEDPNETAVDSFVVWSCIISGGTLLVILLTLAVFRMKNMTKSRKIKAKKQGFNHTFELYEIEDWQQKLPVEKDLTVVNVKRALGKSSVHDDADEKAVDGIYKRANGVPGESEDNVAFDFSLFEDKKEHTKLLKKFKPLKDSKLIQSMSREEQKQLVYWQDEEWEQKGKGGTALDIFIVVMCMLDSALLAIFLSMLGTLQYLVLETFWSWFVTQFAIALMTFHSHVNMQSWVMNAYAVSVAIINFACLRYGFPLNETTSILWIAFSQGIMIIVVLFDSAVLEPCCEFAPFHWALLRISHHAFVLIGYIFDAVLCKQPKPPYLAD